MKTICLATIAFAVNAVELSTSVGRASPQDKKIIARQQASKEFVDLDTNDSNSLENREMRSYYNSEDAREVGDFTDFMNQVDFDKNGEVDAFEFFEEWKINNEDD